MSTANRRDIARKISEITGYYIQDVEEILEAETKAISEMSSKNRFVITRPISVTTVYYIHDVEKILEANIKAISELLDEDYDLVKFNKYFRTGDVERKAIKKWVRLNKKNFTLPNRTAVQLTRFAELDNDAFELMHGD
ncbi:putative integration host factor [Staphylococcus phage vB_SauH_DELF3]|nr:putative integration host factor [Staphylococcus phage vB_SauH_DELF3]